MSAVSTMGREYVMLESRLPFFSESFRHPEIRKMGALIAGVFLVGRRGAATYLMLLIVIFESFCGKTKIITTSVDAL